VFSVDSCGDFFNTTARSGTGFAGLAPRIAQWAQRLGRWFPEKPGDLVTLTRPWFTGLVLRAFVPICRVAVLTESGSSCYIY